MSRRELLAPQETVVLPEGRAVGVWVPPAGIIADVI